MINGQTPTNGASSSDGGDFGTPPIPGITPPPDNRRGDLKKAMEKAGIDPPPDMTKPQAHHNLPWKYKDWFAGPERGLNVNDPQFGRYVSGSPVGRHQNWTADYNRRWADFIRTNPNATQQQVLSFLNQLLTSGDFSDR